MFILNMLKWIICLFLWMSHIGCFTLGCNSQPAGGKFPEPLNQVRVRYEMTPAGGGARGLSRQRAARARALFSHDQPEEHLGENFQYRLGWRRFFNKNLFILKTSFVLTIFIQSFNHKLCTIACWFFFVIFRKHKLDISQNQLFWLYRLQTHHLLSHFLSNSNKSYVTLKVF